MLNQLQNTITCPQCGKTVEITEALKRQIEDKILSSVHAQHREELEEMKKKVILQVKAEVAAEMELKLKDSLNEGEEVKKQNKTLRDQLLDMNKLFREMKVKDEERELTMQKSLQSEIEKIKETLSKQYYDQQRLKDLEKDKKIADMEKLVEELKRKAEQGSMQTQGEVLELDLEEQLGREFPHDEIIPVAKGIHGADIKHIVKSPRGMSCGTILWEVKRTKQWSDEWIVKLKSDLRAEKAHIPAIVSQTLPKEAKDGIGLKDGVWVCSYALIMPLAYLLRKNLWDVAYQKAVASNKETKAEQLYAFVTSHEFAQSVEVLVEVYRETIKQIGDERLVFEKRWKQREMQATRLLKSTANLYGGMQTIVGATMPQIKGLEIFELESGIE